MYSTIRCEECGSEIDMDDSPSTLPLCDCCYRELYPDCVLCGYATHHTELVDKQCEDCYKTSTEDVG